jgi:uncharacterized protein (DUF1778 family)
MPRSIIEDNSRVAIRIKPSDKALIMRAVALQQTDMTEFILRTVLSQARQVIQEDESVKLSQRDSIRVMDVLENPPRPNARLLKAARAMPKLK